MASEIHVVDASAGHGQRVAQRHGVGIAEVEAVQPLGDDDREAPVGRVVEVVRVGPPEWARRGFPVLGSIGVRLLPTSLSTYSVREIVRGSDMLGQRAHRVVPDALIRARVDDVHRVRTAVRHVDEGAARRAEA